MPTPHSNSKSPELDNVPALVPGSSTNKYASSNNTGSARHEKLHPNFLKVEVKKADCGDVTIVAMLGAKVKFEMDKNMWDSAEEDYRKELVRDKVVEHLQRIVEGRNKGVQAWDFEQWAKEEIWASEFKEGIGEPTPKEKVGKWLSQVKES